MDEATAKAFLDELQKIAAQDKEAFGSRGRMAKAVAEEAGTAGSSMLGRLMPGSRGAMERAVAQTADEMAHFVPPKPKTWWQRAADTIRGFAPKAEAEAGAAEQVGKQGLTAGQKVMAGTAAAGGIGGAGVIAGHQMAQPQQPRYRYA